MTVTQKELPMFQHAPDDPNVRWLEDLLRARRGWMTAAEIAALTEGRIGDRDIRALASASKQIISGQKGYKHLDHASPEESAHAANWLESQAKKMSERAGVIRRNAHKRIG